MKYLVVSARVWVSAHVVWGEAVTVSPYDESVVGGTKTLDTGSLSTVIDPDLTENLIVKKFQAKSLRKLAKLTGGCYGLGSRRGSVRYRHPS